MWRCARRRSGGDCDSSGPLLRSVEIKLRLKRFCWKQDLGVPERAQRLAQNLYVLANSGACLLGLESTQRDHCEIDIDYVPTELMTRDYHTKPLVGATFYRILNINNEGKHLCRESCNEYVSKKFAALERVALKCKQHILATSIETIQLTSKANRMPGACWEFVCIAINEPQAHKS